MVPCDAVVRLGDVGCKVQGLSVFGASDGIGTLRELKGSAGSPGFRLLMNPMGLNHKPPKPSLNPKPQTVNPKPQTPNPKP